MKSNHTLTRVILISISLIFFSASIAQTQIGVDIVAESQFDRCGKGVSLSNDGTVLAVGAVQNDGNGDNSGHVRVYKSSNGEWSQLGEDIDGEARGDKSGNAVSLSGDGTIVAIGASSNTGNGSNSGHVRVYQYTSSTWSQLGEDIDGDPFDEIGESVSLSDDGTVLAIGSGSNYGNVKVYKYISGQWSQLGADIEGEISSGYGNSISLSDNGTVIAIGNSSNKDNGQSSGQTRVFQYDSGTWSQLGANINGEASDQSGGAVSLSDDGTILAIGALGNDDNGPNSGRVRVYQYISDNWSQLGADIKGDAMSRQTGLAVSLSDDGTILAIGSISDRVRIFQYKSNSWSQFGENIDGNPGDKSGGRGSLSLSDDGTVVAIGASFSFNNNRIEAEKVGVFGLSTKVGVGSELTKSLVKIHPNPTSNEVQITVDQNLLGTTYTVLNSHGQIVIEGKIKSINTMIELRSLSEGLYIVQMGDILKQSFRVIKN
jgi:hypothetical protein